MVRRGCTRCVIKHVAQAQVLLLEHGKGYSWYKFLAIGHLAEAEDECSNVTLRDLIHGLRTLVETGDEQPEHFIEIWEYLNDAEGKIV